MVSSTAAPFHPDSSVVEYLARHPFFDTLLSDDLAALAQQAVLRHFDAGETIFLDGDPCAGLWVIQAGSIKIYKLNPDGDEHILHLLGPGDTFNEVSALDGGPNPASAAALVASTCWLLPSEAISRALRTHPELALSVISKLTARVRTLVDHIDSLALYPAAARLARFLLQQSETAASNAPHVSRAAISAHLGTTPETISRLLRSFEEAGAIQFDRHHIVIVDAAALRTIAIL